MVEHRDDLGNAIALNSSMVNGARLIGPSIAGMLVATVGEGICFLLNAASYLAVLLALAAMRIPPRDRPHRAQSHILRELREGIAYAVQFSPIRSILLLVALVSLMGMPYAVLLPIFAKDILQGGAHTFGFLVTASGCGALAGTLFLASRHSVLGLGKVIVRSTVCFSGGMAIFALSNNLALSLAALAISGFGALPVVASCNTILQTILEEDKRGRVMSLFTMAFIGMAPFGNLAAGWLAGTIGPRYTLLIGGAGCLAGAMVFLRQLPQIRNSVRPIYERMGIIREAASNRETAAEQPHLKDGPVQ
jgi:MFS family permease